jgi:Flp pilus assembly pilin Flp
VERNNGATNGVVVLNHVSLPLPSSLDKRTRDRMMARMKSWLELWLDNDAVTALEYALIAGVLVATILIGFNAYEGDLTNHFSNIGSSL